MRKFLIAVAMSLFVFGGLSQGEASTVQKLDEPIAEAQEMGKWAHFRDKYILGRETENERRDRKEWEQKHNAREQWERDRRVREQWERDRRVREQWEKERRAREQWEKERRAREQWEKDRRAREQWERRHRYKPPSFPPRHSER